GLVTENQIIFSLNTNTFPMALRTKLSFTKKEANATKLTSSKQFTLLSLVLLILLANEFAYANETYHTPPKEEEVFFHEGNGNGHIQELNTNFRLYNICNGDLEGYQEMISGSEFFTYPSIREDISTSMIARATTGKMGFEFLTGVVPKDYDQDRLTFFMLSDIDLNQREPFDVLVNDQPLLTFHSNADGSLTVMENPGQGAAEYLLVKRDANGDGIGAFRLSMPTKMVKKGTSAKIKFVGKNKGANSWIMIFKATDAVSRIKKSVMTEAAFVIKERNGNLYVDAPTHFAGKKVT
ncbi:MAG: hypothetical protein AAF705_20395, partial [Bacteroidota bacterium]